MWNMSVYLTVHSLEKNKIQLVRAISPILVFFFAQWKCFIYGMSRLNNLNNLGPEVSFFLSLFIYIKVVWLKGINTLWSVNTSRIQFISYVFFSLHKKKIFLNLFHTANITFLIRSKVYHRSNTSNLKPGYPIARARLLCRTNNWFIRACNYEATFRSDCPVGKQLSISSS